METFQKYQKDFILLAEAGFIAVNQADEDAAIKLFKASELLNPHNPLSNVGIGYMHLCKLELKQARKHFEDVLAKDPNNEMAKAFLGLSLALNPSDIAQGERLLQESAKQSSDPMVKNVATSAIAFVEQFVKKTPSPAKAATSQEAKKQKS